MKGIIKEEYFKGRKLFIYMPPSYGKKGKTFPVLYSHDGKEVESLLEGLLPEIELSFDKRELEEFIWVGIYSEQRQHEYTPWPMPALVSRFEDFKGLGKDYIHFVTKELKGYIDKNYFTKPEAADTWMMGYSLGGLISIYAIYETTCLGKIGCICGSFWYQSMREWVQQHKPLNEKLQVLIYYGKKEGKSSQTIQRHAVECTEQVIKYLKRQMENTDQLEIAFDEGGHHYNLEERYKKVIFWLARRK
ncbi:hypothetical protein CS063_14410 [Sporanaerobium hydrogeniformans]|uniref:Uncharacterized protein n=1 Tax=Sporanaerobium hydrogeniformans TaxID=3072179 RepID=A0AC61DAD3_9FIRM|nr:alpha/beta hydrolase-fold protein [Sporanaerobium hydrogeniformans]PHV69686.1 hypothetical protein CS063_14410 [Sporanaerobium hydrogeniformans]